MTHINDDIEYVEDTIPATRHNLDKRETNAYGYAVLDLCKSSCLRILNCHFGKDTNIGHFTCITDNSVSVIDYFVADFDFVNIVSELEIHHRLESTQVCGFSSGFQILITYQTILKYCQKIFQLKEIVLDIF